MQESLLAKVAQVDVKLEFDDPLTREEIKKATKQLKAGNSPGTDGISSEVYQREWGGGGQCSINSRGTQSLPLCTKQGR